MIETFTALLTAHLIADFLVQTDWLVARKAQWQFLVLHVASVSMITALAIGAIALPAFGMVALITATHFAFDYIKVHYVPDNLMSFTADQCGHIAVIAMIAFLQPELAWSGAWALLSGPGQAWLYTAMTFTSGMIVAVPMGGIVIKKMVQTIAPLPSSVLAPNPATPAASTAPPAPGQTGMAKGGKYIGWLERGLIVLFMLTGKVEGVGFLLAAKSILRFGDIRDDAARHLQEYIIIGTLLSFGWGLVIAMLTVKALAYWGAA